MDGGLRGRSGVLNGRRTFLAYVGARSQKLAARLRQPLSGLMYLRLLDQEDCDIRQVPVRPLKRNCRVAPQSLVWLVLSASSDFSALGVTRFVFPPWDAA